VAFMYQRFYSEKDVEVAAESAKPLRKKRGVWPKILQEVDVIYFRLKK
jgi:hypothetical protein